MSLVPRNGKDCGRVKVFVRVRPFLEHEVGADDSMPFSISQKDAQVNVYAADEKCVEKSYTFDQIFSKNDKNDQVCKILTEPLIQSVMNGFNSTLIAYGQTCAGKSYTLMSETGISQSLINCCFEKIRNAPNDAFKVTVSYLQIYQEKIFDLLADGKRKMDLSIRENPTTGIYVENLTEYVVRSPKEVEQLISKGESSLVFAETKMNRHSNRSHSVLQVVIERTKGQDIVHKGLRTSEDPEAGKNEDGEHDDFSAYLDSFGNDIIIRGKLSICDLAGSERIKRSGSERLSETQAINSSLLELGNVIQALATEKATYVPYRNSILTRLLQESLGGNCKTNLIICVSPSTKDIQETKNALNFGQRAMNVRNKAIINIEVDYKKLSEYLFKRIDAKENEIKQLQASFNKRLKEKYDNIEKQIRQDQEEYELLLKRQSEMHSKEAQSLEDQLLLLSEEVLQKEEKINSIEVLFHTERKSLNAIRVSMMSLLKIEEIIDKLFTISTNAEMTKQFNLISFIFEPLRTHYETVKRNSPIAEELVVNFISIINEKISDYVNSSCDETINSERLSEMKTVLDDFQDNLSNFLPNESESVECFNSTDKDMELILHKLVLKNMLNWATTCLQFIQVESDNIELEKKILQISLEFRNQKSCTDSSNIEFQNSLASVRQDMLKLEEENCELSKRVDRMKCIKEENECTIESKNCKISRLESDLLELRLKIEGYENRREEKSISEEETNQTISDLQQSLDEFSTQLIAYKSDLNLNEKLIQRISLELSEINLEKNELLNKIECYANAIDEKDQIISNMRGGKDLKNKNHAISVNKNGRTDDIANLKSENEELWSQIVSLKATIEEYKQGNEDTNEKLKEKELEKSDFLSKLEIYRAAIATKDALCQQLSSRICDLVTYQRLVDLTSQSESDIEEYQKINGERERDSKVINSMPLFHSDKIIDKSGAAFLKYLISEELVSKINDYDRNLRAEFNSQEGFEDHLHDDENLNVLNTPKIQDTSDKISMRRWFEHHSHKSGFQPICELSGNAVISLICNALGMAEKARTSLKEEIKSLNKYQLALVKKNEELKSIISNMRTEKEEYAKAISESNHSAHTVKKSDASCQTDDSSHYNHTKRFSNSLKIAHIKPLLSSEKIPLHEDNEMHCELERDLNPLSHYHWPNPKISHRKRREKKYGYDHYNSTPNDNFFGSREKASSRRNKDRYLEAEWLKYPHPFSRRSLFRNASFEDQSQAMRARHEKSETWYGYSVNPERMFDLPLSADEHKQGSTERIHHRRVKNENF